MQGICAIVIEFCRAVPVLIMMIFFWRAFAFLDLPSPSYWAVVISLVFYNGSVVAELIRSGVGNLPGGQHEAAVALGMTRTQSLMSIEVPQAIYAMLPAAVTQLVVVLKDTALGSIIMYTDLLQESRRLGSMYFNILQTLVVAAVIYFIICWLLSRLAEWLPVRMQQHTLAPTEPEPVAPIAIMDPSNVNQIAVAKEGARLAVPSASIMCTIVAPMRGSMDGDARAMCKATMKHSHRASMFRPSTICTTIRRVQGSGDRPSM